MNILAQINIMAVLAASVLSFLIGFVWYTFLFSKPWMKALGINIEDVESSGLSSMRAIIASFFASFLTAGGIAVLFAWLGVNSIQLAIMLAIVLWISFSLTPMFKMIFWEDRPTALFAIDGGYELASILGAAFVLLLWQ